MSDAIFEVKPLIVLHPAGVIRPVQERLPLPRTAQQIATHTVSLELTNVATHVQPAANLPVIIRMTTPHVVAAIPLKPTARIVAMDPTLVTPIGQRLGGRYPEEVEAGIARFRTKLGSLEPVGRKLIATVSHVLSAEDTHCQHLAGRQLWNKSSIETRAHPFSQLIDIVPLHAIMDCDQIA